MTRVLCLVLCVAMGLACSREDFTAVEEPPSQLLGDFQSYATAEEVREQFSLDGWEVVEDSGLGEWDRRPPYDNLTVSIPYEHLAMPGELMLRFFNDRLIASSFHPAEFDEYLDRLVQAGLTGDRGADVSVPPATVIRWSEDGPRGAFVMWEDRRLRDQESRWIMRYSWRLPPNKSLKRLTVTPDAFASVAPAA